MHPLPIPSSIRSDVVKYDLTLHISKQVSTHTFASDKIHPDLVNTIV